MNHNLFMEFIANCNLYAETNHEGLQSFLWKGFIPLMKIGHEFDRELLNQVEQWGVGGVLLCSLYLRF